MRVFQLHNVFVNVLGVAVDLKHLAFAAQVNTAIIATRFAVRSLADEKNLMFCIGLVRVRLPLPIARELRAVILAERKLRTTHVMPYRRPKRPTKYATHVEHDNEREATHVEQDSEREASPREASPRKASPREASPREASPREATPREASTHKASPRVASPRKAFPREAP
jgi:hypothetical protein